MVLACVKAEAHRRHGTASSHYTQYLWRIFQSYYTGSSKLSQDDAFDTQHRQKQSVLGLMLTLSKNSCAAQRLSGHPKTNLDKLTILDKATIIQLTGGPWLTAPSSDVTTINKIQAPSISPVRQAVFRRLSPDAQDLVGLMTFAGGHVPKVFLWDACRPRMWSPKGEVCPVKQIMTGCLENIQRCEAAVQELLSVGAVHQEPNNGPPFPCPSHRMCVCTLGPRIIKLALFSSIVSR